MIKAGVLFGGFGGVEIGMLQAGITPVWSVELRPDVAAVAEMNFEHKVIRSDILDVDPHTLEKVDILHTSPPCIYASQANTTAEINENGTKETPLDIALARRQVEFTEVLMPRIVTLENVYGYRKFQSFQGGNDFEGIVPALLRFGYHVRWWHLNCADFGVPQTRKRLIMVAALDFIPQRPKATHQDISKISNSQISLFDNLPLWNNWYQAIKNLIPDLPDSQFAPWQLARLPDEPKTFIVANGCYEDLVIREMGESVFTITGNSNQTGVRAFLVNSQNSTRPLTIRDEGSPAFVTTANAFEKSPPKAFIVGGQYQTPNTSKRIVQNRNDDCPVWTITASEHGDMRAWLSCGRVVSMTVRALARFQSFPDSYRLPATNKLACYGIGNAMPPLAYRTIIKGLIGGAV